MKTIQEVMEKYHLTKKEYALSEGGSYYTVENIEAAMAEYADQFKVKNLAQPDVSGELHSSIRHCTYFHIADDGKLRCKECNRLY